MTAQNADLRGFDWGYDSGPPYSHSWTEGTPGSYVYGTGAFSYQVTGLIEGVTVYFRAKAHNSAGWGYGGELSFKTGETRSVVVTAESLDKTTAYEGDTVTYTATVKDSNEAALPTTFVVDLDINSEKIITGQSLNAEVYEPGSFVLTLTFTVPATVGAHTVKLVWAEQLI